jgi:hypothetical protein
MTASLALCLGCGEGDSPVPRGSTLCRPASGTNLGGVHRCPSRRWFRCCRSRAGVGAAPAATGASLSGALTPARDAPLRVPSITAQCTAVVSARYEYDQQHVLAYRKAVRWPAGGGSDKKELADGAPVVRRSIDNVVKTKIIL